MEKIKDTAAAIEYAFDRAQAFRLIQSWSYGGHDSERFYSITLNDWSPLVLDNNEQAAAFASGLHAAHLPVAAY